MNTTNDDFLTGDGLVLADIDWAAEPDELIKDVAFAESIGVTMTYETENTPTGWPVAKFVAKDLEAKQNLIDWLVDVGYDEWFIVPMC